jgi:hypothetical protein
LKLAVVAPLSVPIRDKETNLKLELVKELAGKKRSSPLTDLSKEAMREERRVGVLG